VTPLGGGWCKYLEDYIFTSPKKYEKSIEGYVLRQLKSKAAP
jgi:hypothetical protein